MATLFISDLHLDAARPQITTLFENYLASDEVRHADALYILGDLVEAWIGDDDDAELPQRIAHAIRAVSDAGVPVYFMVGNRDFLLGEAFAQRVGMTLLDDGRPYASRCAHRSGRRISCRCRWKRAASSPPRHARTAANIPAARWKASWM